MSETIAEYDSRQLTAAETWELLCDPEYVATEFQGETIGLLRGKPVKITTETAGEFWKKVEPEAQRAIGKVAAIFPDWMKP